MALSSFFDQLHAGPGVEWPKILFGQTASIFSALYGMSLTERLAPDKLARMQDLQLQQLLDHSVTHVPYYRDVLRGAGFTAGKTAVEEVWKAIPILTRSDVQDHATRLRAETYPKSHGAVRERSTSGSTSRPVRVATTDLTDFLWTCTNMRDRAWHRIDLSGTLVVLADGVKAMGDRPVVGMGSWSLPPSALLEPGKQFHINPMLSVADQVCEIGKLKPSYLHTRPSQLNLIIKHCQATRLRLDGLRAVFCISEVVTDELRHECRRVLHAELVENYSCAEMGHLALQCPENGKLHVQSELVRLEVLTADNEACAPGEIGRVVVTSLHNYAMPLIRYEVGDEAQLGPPCPCGRGLPVIDRIVGRTQDYLVLPSGNRVRMNTYHYRIATMPKIREFQIVQRSADVLEVRLVVDAPLDENERQKLTALLVNQGNYRFAVDIIYCDALKRTKSGKLQTFVSEVSQC